MAVLDPMSEESKPIETRDDRGGGCTAPPESQANLLACKGLFKAEPRAASAARAIRNRDVSDLRELHRRPRNRRPSPVKSASMTAAPASPPGPVAARWSSARACVRAAGSRHWPSHQAPSSRWSRGLSGSDLSASSSKRRLSLRPDSSGSSRSQRASRSDVSASRMRRLRVEPPIDLDGQALFLRGRRRHR